MPATKRTRKCKLCKTEKDRYSAFYSPDDSVCMECNADWRFIKSLRHLFKTRGAKALEERIHDYMHRAEVTRNVLKDMSKVVSGTIPRKPNKEAHGTSRRITSVAR